MSEEDVRQKMLDIVGDIYHADSADYVGNGFDNFDGHTWNETNDVINKAFDGLEPDHPKVNLPWEVSEELDDYQAEDIDLLDYLHDVIDSEELRVTRVWMLHDREHRIGILADAYRYGWEAEPEAKWYVQAPKEWCPEFTFWICKDGSKVYPTLQGYMDYPAFNQQFQFTRAELKKYHLDSDIFTLVPVGEEK